MILDNDLLKLYASNGFNVLLSGRHGVGKTAIIKEVFGDTFGENNWAYFSASTMDAWVDFVGVPKAVKRESDGMEVIELIRPARFADDSVQAIFFDEFNRAPAKVRNAVMELIQFKSINGRKFNNLKVIWAAINPFSEDAGGYDVEQIDPAQLDRFQVQIDVPYKVDRPYMKAKHGALATPFVEWWNSLDKEMQYKVSPRRLEDALMVYSVKGNLEHVLPKESNLAALRDRITKVSLDDEWKDVVSLTNNDKLNFLQNVSNVVKFKDFIIKDFANYAKFVPEDFLISKLEIKDLEWLDAAVANPSKIPDTIVATMENTHKKDFSDILKELKNILPSNISMNLNGKNVVVTGKFTKRYKNGILSRTDVEDLLQRIGAKVQASVNGSTHYLIVEDKNTTTVKMQKAQQNGVNIISEDEFHAVYGNF